MRAISFLLAFICIIAYSGTAYAESPKKVILGEDFGIGIQLGSSKQVLKDLPDYTYRVIFSKKPLRESYLFIEGKGFSEVDLNLIEPDSSSPKGSPERKKHEEAYKAWGKASKDSYLDLLFSNDALVGVRLDALKKDDFTERLSLFSVPLSELTPNRLKSIAPWLTDETAGATWGDPSTQLGAFTYYEISNDSPIMWEMEGAFLRVWTRGEEVTYITLYYPKAKKKKRFLFF